MKKNKKDSLIFLVSHGSYPFDILVAIYSTDKQVKNYLKKKCNYELDEDEERGIECPGVGRTAMLSNGATVLRVEDRRSKGHFHATLAHEVFHAVEFLFNRVGIKHCDESSEAFAYQIGYILGEFYKMFYRKT